MIYGYVWSLLKVLGCIHYTSSPSSTLQGPRLLHIKIQPSFSTMMLVSVSVSDSSPHPLSLLQSHRGCDCYQHSLSLSLYLGYSLYDNYYVCQSAAVTHLDTLSSHSCIQGCLCTKRMFTGRFSACLRLQWNTVVHCAWLESCCGIKADRLVTQFDCLTHGLKKASDDITLV